MITINPSLERNSYTNQLYYLKDKLHKLYAYYGRRTRNSLWISHNQHASLRSGKHLIFTRCTSKPIISDNKFQHAPKVIGYIWTLRNLEFVASRQSSM